MSALYFEVDFRAFALQPPIDSVRFDSLVHAHLEAARQVHERRALGARLLVINGGTGLIVARVDISYDDTLFYGAWKAAQEYAALDTPAGAVPGAFDESVLVDDEPCAALIVDASDSWLQVPGRVEHVRAVK